MAEYVERETLLTDDEERMRYKGEREIRNLNMTTKTGYVRKNSINSI